MKKKPNILLITSDQQHHDTIGKFNSKIHTPHLDNLCNEGMNFTRAYCPSPVCTPSRASIITGLYPSSHGAWTIGVKLEETVETIGELLYKNGYSTGLIGKAHFQPLTSVPGQESIEGQPTLRDLNFWKNFKGPWYGFEHIELARNHADESHVGQHYAIWMEKNGLKDWKEYFQPVPGETSKYAPTISQEYDYWARPDRAWKLDEKFHYTNWTSERSINFLENQKTEDKPFFLWTSFQDPHPPYVLSEPWASMYDSNDMSPGTLKEGEHELNPPHFGKTQTSNPDFENWHSPFNAHGCMSHLYPMDELKKDMAIYYGMVSFMDKNIGKIISKLDQIGELDNTIIIFTTDHGHFIGQHGLIAKGPFHYEDMLRLPFIVRWPGKVPENTSSSSLISLVDLSSNIFKDCWN
jgi:arylsulfatase A-like enzyme